VSQLPLYRGISPEPIAALDFHTKTPPSATYNTIPQFIQILQQKNTAQPEIKMAVERISSIVKHLTPGSSGLSSM
jgi:hypothetical protein